MDQFSKGDQDQALLTQIENNKDSLARGQEVLKGLLYDDPSNKSQDTVIKSIKTASQIVKEYQKDLHDTVRSLYGPPSINARPSSPVTSWSDAMETEDKEGDKNTKSPTIKPGLEESTHETSHSVSKSLDTPLSVDSLPSTSTASNSPTVKPTIKESKFSKKDRILGREDHKKGFLAWKKLYPETLLAKYYQEIKRHKIANSILDMCVEELLGASTDDDISKLDFKWNLILSGAEMQANVDTLKETELMLSNLSTLIGNLRDKDATTHNAITTMVENTMAYQKHMEDMSERNIQMSQKLYGVINESYDKSHHVLHAIEEMKNPSLGLDIPPKPSTSVPKEIQFYLGESLIHMDTTKNPPSFACDPAKLDKESWIRIKPVILNIPIHQVVMLQGENVLTAYKSLKDSWDASNLIKLYQSR